MGAAVNRPAQRSLSASRSRSTPLLTGVHLTKCRLAPSPTSKVWPPISLTHTSRTGLPAAVAALSGADRRLASEFNAPRPRFDRVRHNGRDHPQLAGRV
jgi:hypothetical protein